MIATFTLEWTDDDGTAETFIETNLINLINSLWDADTFVSYDRNEVSPTNVIYTITYTV